MAFTEEMLAEDWMNNSAWNARFQCVTVCLERGDVGVLEREAAFATTAPRVDDDNESAWNYLRGLCAIAERDGSAIPRDVANRVVALAIDAARTAAAPAPSRVPSRHAALLLADRVAAEAVRDFGLGQMELPSLVSYIDLPNTQSAAVAERLGAKRDAQAEAMFAEPVQVWRHQLEAYA